MKKGMLFSTLLSTILASGALADNYYDPAPINAPAVNNFYVGLAYGYANVSDDYIDYLYGDTTHTDIDFNTLMLQAGYQYNPYVAFEFRYWISMGDGEYDFSSNFPYVVPNGSYSDLDAWGFYVKPMYPVSPEFSIYGLLGFSGVTVSGEPQWGRDLLNDGDFSWGLGASYSATPNVLIFADYVWLYDDWIDYPETSQETSVDVFTVGISYRF
jgi:opacity protein-like surface antigen